MPPTAMAARTLAPRLISARLGVRARSLSGLLCRFDIFLVRSTYLPTTMGG